MIAPQTPGTAREAALDRLLEQDMRAEAVLEQFTANIWHTAEKAAKVSLFIVSPSILLALAYFHVVPA